MEFLKFLFTLLLTYQISQIVSESSFPLFRFFRNLDQNYYLTNSIFKYPALFISELTSCFLCTSVWVGIILSLKFFDISRYIGYNEYSCVWSGLVYSVLVWFIHVWEASR